MEAKHLLVIEDENEIRELVEIILRRQGYQVSSFASVEDFQSHSSSVLPSSPYDLILLDWMLPGQSGFDFLKSARKKEEWRYTPIIMLTAKAEPEEIVLGLESGADDYLIKPFDATVLLARVKALLRRSGHGASVVGALSSSGFAPGLMDLVVGPLRVNLKNYEAFLNNEKLPLTPTEFKLLALMAQQRGRVFTREQLVKSVQGEGINVIGRTVDTHVFSLRKKLGDWGEHIETARGIGYRFKDIESIS